MKTRQAVTRRNVSLESLLCLDGRLIPAGERSPRIRRFELRHGHDLALAITILRQVYPRNGKVKRRRALKTRAKVSNTHALGKSRMLSFPHIILENTAAELPTSTRRERDVTPPYVDDERTQVIRQHNGVDSYCRSCFTTAAENSKTCNKVSRYCMYAFIHA